MPHLPGTEASAKLLVQSRLALQLTQTELATMLGVTRRTIGRWEGCESTPSVNELRQLARAVYPKDSTLAGEVAVEGGTTLDALGLVDLAPNVEPVLSVALTRSRPFPPVDLMIDSVVHVASQALGAHDAYTDPEGTVRAVLVAAFTRARGLGLTVEEAEEALSEKVDSAEPTKRETPEPTRSAGRSRGDSR